MAAIFGIIATSPGADLDALAASIQDRLVYRAPDGFTRWRQDGCVLAHGALHLGTRPAQASQPLRMADGRICVMDGYISNYDDVGRALGLDPGLALDDAQLLALAVERWGNGFTDRVQGEFALALWDPRARALDLYRDHLGARPLCYVHTSQLFAFASTSLPLTRLPGVGARLDPLGIVTLWYGDAGYLHQDYTAFEGVHALPPAHHLRWRGGEPADPRRYWRLAPRDPVRRRDEREYVEAFRDVFGGAVARAMRGSADTALMLSGGIDSAAILAARRGFREEGVADDLLCISAVLAPGTQAPWAQEENRNILAMTDRHPRSLQFGVPVTDEPGSLVTSADLAEAAWSWMHPADSSLLVPSLACGLAKRSGCSLILNGVDGDNMTSPGGNHLAMLIREGRFRRAWIESRRAGTVNTYLRGQPPATLLARALLAAAEPRTIRRLRHLHRVERSICGLALHPVMTPSLADATDLPRRLREAAARQSRDDPDQRCAHRAYWLAFSLDGSSQIVSRHGMEARHPWCDMQVLDFFEGLPTEVRVRHGWTKWVVRAACQDALGADVAWHSGKSHLGAALTRQVVEEAAPYLRQLLVDQRSRLLEYVREDAVTELFEGLERREFDDPQLCDRVLEMVALAGWVRHVHGSNRGIAHA